MFGLGCLSYNVTHQAFHNPDIKINRHSRSVPFIHDVEEAEAWDGHHKEMSRWNRPGVDVGQVSVFEPWIKPPKVAGLAAQYGPAPPGEPGMPQPIKDEDIDVNAFPNKPSPPPTVRRPEFVHEARASQAARLEKPAPAWTPSLDSTNKYTSLPPYPGIGPDELLGTASEPPESKRLDREVLNEPAHHRRGDVFTSESKQTIFGHWVPPAGGGVDGNRHLTINDIAAKAKPPAQPAVNAANPRTSLPSQEYDGPKMDW